MSADGPLDAELSAVPSKSVTHRALVAAALADGASTLHGPLDADDTRATRDGLSALGVSIDSGQDRWIVRGRGADLPGGARLSVGDSGTSLRFLTAVAALGREASRIDGSPRLRQRPIRELISALGQLDASIEPGPSPGGLPLRVGGSMPRGGSLRLAGGRSSQFASALLLIGPGLAGGVEVELEPPVVSLPYVELTARVLAQFGAGIERPSPTRFRVRPGRLGGRDYRIEGDHSSASYLLAAAAVVGGRVRVNGLSPSEQPDAGFGPILEALGCAVRSGRDWVEVEGSGSVAAFDLDLAHAPDLVPTLAVLALFADGPCALRGIPHLRHKESDRLEVLAHNLRALGRQVTELPDGLSIGVAESRTRGTVIRTDSDHRMTMAFAVAGLRVQGISVDDPACVAKSHPGFWRQLERLQGGTT